MTISLIIKKVYRKKIAGNKGELIILHIYNLGNAESFTKNVKLKKIYRKYNVGT